MIEKDPNIWLKNLNQTIPIHSMWDGFWIREYRKKDLIISCSFDRILYRNFDIIFKDVRFFNIPNEWRDTDVPSDELFELQDKEEFARIAKFPLAEDEFVFSLDLDFKGLNTSNNYYTFHIVAKHLFVEDFSKTVAKAFCEYVDPLESENFPSLKNRVDFL